MTVTVYIWFPEESKSSLISAARFYPVGHVAMQINDIYISHRPASSNQRSVDRKHISQSAFEKNPIYIQIGIDEFIELYSSTDDKDNTIKYVKVEAVERAYLENDTYQKECERRGRKADERVPMDWLDEDKMLKYYSSLSSKNLKYHPITKNCCTFVVDIIKHSLGCPKSSGILSEDSCNFCRFIDTREYFIYIKDNYQEIFKIAKHKYQKNYLPNVNVSNIIAKLSVEIYLHQPIKLINSYRYIMQLLIFMGMHAIVSVSAYYVWTPNQLFRFLCKLNLQEMCLKDNV